jgi:hypothetical protein
MDALTIYAILSPWLVLAMALGALRYFSWEERREERRRIPPAE